MDLIELYNGIARRKLRQPDSWRMYALEVVGPDLMLTGSDTRPLLRGARKGKPKHIGPSERCCVTPAELQAARLEYEAESGCCSTCFGERQTIASYAPDGATYRPCAACGGTGQATLTVKAAA